MIILKSDDLEKIVTELGNSINEALIRLSNIPLFDVENDINAVIKELKSKFRDTNIVRGNGLYNMKNKTDLEVQYVFSAGAYLSVLKDVVNYYTDLLMMLKQVYDIMEKLSIKSGITIIIDKGHNTVDLLVGSEMPSTYFLIESPRIIEKEEIPSILDNIKGLSPEEKREISDLIDQFMVNTNKEVIIKETTINVNEYEYPDKIKKAKEILQGDAP